jgi:hypothetical protein
MNAGRKTPTVVGSQSVPRGTHTSRSRTSNGGLVHQKAHQKVQCGLIDLCCTWGCPPAVMLDVEGFHRHLTTRPPRDEQRWSSGSQVPVPACVHHDGGRASDLNQSAPSQAEGAVLFDAVEDDQRGSGRTAPEPLFSLSPFESPTLSCPSPRVVGEAALVGDDRQLRWAAARGVSDER